MILLHPTSIKILIVEDESLVAEDLAAILQERGYQIVGCAGDGKSALQLFQDEQPDLVLMDIKLRGETDGVMVAEQINAWRRVPIIYLTAQADAESIARARATQPAAYLLKPFDERSILIAIDIAIGNFSAQQTAAHPTEAQLSAAKAQLVTKERLNSDNILSAGDTLFIKQNYRFVKFSAADLLYIEADGSHCYLYTLGGKFIMRLSLNQILEKLPEELHIVRVHRSYAVRRAAIDSFSDTEVLIRQQSIPIGYAYREAFLQGFEVL